MDYSLFSPLHVSGMTLTGLYSLNKSTIELATPLIAELGTIPGAALAQLEKMQLELGASINKAQKSALSKALAELDKSRDNDLLEIFRMTAAFVRSSDESKKSASSTLQLFLSPFKGAAKQPINIETATIATLTKNYTERPDLKAAATTLGINNLFASMEATNTELNGVYQSRNTEYAERETAASESKPAATTAYLQFCTAIEQANSYTPSDTFSALFNKMDELRKKYHALEGAKVEQPETSAN